MKIRPVGAELFREDGQTDTTKLIVAFRNFANAPKTDAHSPKTIHGCVLVPTRLHFASAHCASSIKCCGILLQFYEHMKTGNAVHKLAT
jgi:hypothetical protein